MKYQLVIIVLLVCSKSLFAQKDTILNIEETTDITTKIYVDVEEKPEFPVVFHFVCLANKTNN